MSASRNKKNNHHHHQPRHSQAKPPANPYTLEFEPAGYYQADVAQLYIPKVLLPPLEPYHTDLNSFWTELENKFRDDLVGSTKKICAIKQSYSPQELDYLNYFVVDYFEMVHTKLQKEDIEYSQVARNEVNYALYGGRFWDWCVESQLYNEHILRNYSILLFKLLSLYPAEMLQLAVNLSANLLPSRRSVFGFNYLAFCWDTDSNTCATFEPEDDPWEIHDFIKRQGECSVEWGSRYYEKTFPTFSNFKGFFVAELKRCLNFHESDLNVEFEILDFCFESKTGECFKWIFSFKGIDEHYNELTLMILAFSVAREHFADQYDILFDIGLNSVTLRFGSSFYYDDDYDYDECEHLKEFASFKIFAHVSSAEYQLFAFLSGLDCFGEFMGHLFYWARQNSLLDGTLFASDLEFAFMILFYLEQPHDKTPFPTIRNLYEDYALFKDSDDLFYIWIDQDFVLASDYLDVDDPLEYKMIFGFFEYYHFFYFSVDVICPYDGFVRDKENYELANECKLSRWICIEGMYAHMHPIPNESCTKERMLQLERAIERMYLVMKDREQPDMFYIEELANPEYFLEAEDLSDGYQIVGDFETEFPPLGSEDMKELIDDELDDDEFTSDLFSDLNVDEKIGELDEIEAETENDLNESSTNESGTEDEQSNPEPAIGEQTGSNEEDNRDDEEDKCQVM